MQNTARETQPVSCLEIEQAILANKRNNKSLPPIEFGKVDKIDDEFFIQWMPKGWVYAKSDFKATPLSVALMATDPLYQISAINTQRSMEREVATELASEFDSLYTKYSGRTRGWVKTAMNKELDQLAAGATDIPFDWTSLLDKKKVLSSIIDIICLKFDVRIAIWWSQHKRLSIWPIQESETLSSTPILNIEVLTSGEAHIMLNPESDIRIKPSLWLSLFQTIGEWQWTRPATYPSISGKTLTDLKAEYAELAGSDDLNGTLTKKIDKETLANIIYRYKWVNVRLAPKKEIFY